MSIAEQTVRELVARFPAAGEVFHRYGMDTCCGSGLPVKKAAQAVGADLKSVVAALEAVLPGDPAGWGEALVYLDNRGLPAPEPMVRVLEGLESLRPGEALQVHNDREPLFLYPELSHRGWRYQTREQADGTFLIDISCAKGEPSAD